VNSPFHPEENRSREAGNLEEKEDAEAGGAG
jgi:hypothetical protein